MLSHDNFTWDAEAIAQYMEVSRGNEVFVSFLPLSHVAAQVIVYFQFKIQDAYVMTKIL
jgi:long-subunit acyl-CoA synthetase (AMP-forming)